MWRRNKPSTYYYPGDGCDGNMYGHQDATLTFLAYRHASCVSELVAGVGTR